MIPCFVNRKRIPSINFSCMFWGEHHNSMPDTHSLQWLARNHWQQLSHERDPTDMCPGLSGSETKPLTSHRAERFSTRPTEVSAAPCLSAWPPFSRTRGHKFQSGRFSPEKRTRNHSKMSSCGITYHIKNAGIVSHTASVFSKKTSYTKNIDLTSYTHFFYLLDLHSTCNLFLWMVRAELFFPKGTPNSPNIFMILSVRTAKA